MNRKRRWGARWRIGFVVLALSGCHQQLYPPNGVATPYAPAAGPWAARTAAPTTVAAAGSPAPMPAVASTGEQRLLRNESAKSGRHELDLRVDRLWQEQGFTYATLSVRNTSPHELEEISIQCTAIGRGHVNLNFREQTLLTRKDGPMRPGFAKTLKIRLERGGFSVREMTCTARGW